MKKNLLLLIAIVFLGANTTVFAQGETCETATVVTAGSHTDPGITLGGLFPGACTPVTDGTNANWYSYTPDADYLVTVSSCLGGADTHLSILTGDCGTLTCFAGNDDACLIEEGGFEYAAEVSFSATAGTTYYIEWQDRWTADGFDWSITEASPLACDIVDMSFVDSGCNDANGDGIWEPSFSFVCNFTGEGCQVEDITWTEDGGDPITINAPGAGFFINPGDTTLFGEDMIPGTVYVFSYTLNDGDVSGDYTYTVGNCDDYILGCLDSMACNYDSTANTDNGTCEYPGCSDSTALNYNPDAACNDDESCIYSAVTCGSTFTDLGGTNGEYGIDGDVWFFACPDSAGHVVTADFSMFNMELNWDFLTIYNGADSTAAVVGTFTGDIDLGAITSTDASGCLTFHFTSDGSVTAPGWEAEISCAPAPECIAPSQVAVSDMTDMTAMVSWIGSPDSTTMYMVEIVLSGDAPTGVGMAATNPYDASGLMAETMYDVYVISDCGEDGMSEWVGPTTFTTTVTPATNNACEGAIAVACDDTVDGDTSAEGVTDTGSEASNDLWYSFTGDGTAQTVTASLCGSGYDTKITIFDACGGTIVAVNDDFCELQSETEFPSDGTSTYFIAVEGWGTSSGAFTLAITCAEMLPPPSNNECATPMALTIGTPAMGEDNTNATANINNPECDLFGVVSDLWYTFEAPEDGLVEVTTTLGTAADAGFAVYEGDCDSLVSIACFDEIGANSSEVTDLTPGDTYYVQVWNNGGDEEGTFDIVVNEFVVDCSVYTGGPYTDFNGTFGGAPVAGDDGVCPVNALGFGAWANEMYTVDGFLASETYTFDICTDFGAGAWAPELTIFDLDMNIIAGPVADCTISFTPPSDGTYLIGINEEGVCGPSTTNTEVDNGAPTLTCAGNVAVNEIENSLNVSIFPNPTEDVLNIQVDGLNSSKTIVNVISLQGKTILSNEYTFNNAIETIDVSTLSTGIYMVEIINGNAITTKKVVIK